MLRDIRYLLWGVLVLLAVIITYERAVAFHWDWLLIKAALGVCLMILVVGLIITRGKL